MYLKYPWNKKYKKRSSPGAVASNLTSHFTTYTSETKFWTENSFTRNTRPFISTHRPFLTDLENHHCTQLQRPISSCSLHATFKVDNLLVMNLQKSYLCFLKLKEDLDITCKLPRKMRSWMCTTLKYTQEDYQFVTPSKNKYVVPFNDFTLPFPQ